MDIKRNGTSPSARGPASWFTGTVRIDTPFSATAPGRAGGAIVTFEPGARTAWHTHPLGQMLIVTAGLGLAQRERVEQAHLNELVARECGQLGVEPRGANVVEQQTHANAALCGGEQFAEQQRARDVVAPDVVLNVQCPVCGTRQQRAGSIGVIGMGQRVDARLAGVLVLQWFQGLA